MVNNLYNTIETIGIIEKKECIVSINYDNLVLESLHPFPGYHGTTVPDKTNPKSIFFILKSKHTEENIIRTILSVKEKFTLKFDASPGMISIYNKLEPCIRIKDLKNYTFIPELLQCFKSEGFLFMKSKEIPAHDGLIRIKKYFILHEIKDGIYLDAETPNIAYFEIPTQLDWDTFEKITLEIKQNIEKNNFDVALGTIYRKKGLIDLIRIFEREVCLDECLFLREKYNTSINKHLKNK